MTKPLRIVDAVAEHDIPAIVDYHRPRSKAKAERIVAEYDRIIELLAVNPYVLAERHMGGGFIRFRRERICSTIVNLKPVGSSPVFSTRCAILTGSCLKR